MPLPDRVFHVEAIILRRHEFGEADRLITCFTPEYGKLRAIAKGSRKPKSRKTGHVELYTRAKMLINRGRELHVISQAEMVEPFMALREDLERGAYATYFAELLDRFTEFEEQNRALYSLLDSAFGWISEPNTDLQLAARFYELHLLELVGFRPSLFKCVIGEEEVKPQDQYFSVVEGGVVCPEHSGGGRLGAMLSLNALKVLRYLQTREYEVVRKLRIGAGIQFEVERILQSYIVHLLELRLKSIEFIRRLRHMDLPESAATGPATPTEGES